MRYVQLALLLLFSTNATAVYEPVDGKMLIGEWCLAQQSLSFYDYSRTPPKDITDKVKSAPGQTYNFENSNTLVVTDTAGVDQEFGYQIGGKKANLIRIKGWQSLKVKTISDTEFVATAMVTIHHRFVRGACSN